MYTNKNRLDKFENYFAQDWKEVEGKIGCQQTDNGFCKQYKMLS